MNAENLFNRFLKRYATVREVKNNKLELAGFLKSFFKFYCFWIEGDMTFGRVALAWIIYFLCNTVIFVTTAHMVRYAILYDEFKLSKLTTNISLILALPLAYLLFKTFFVQQKEWQALLAELGNFEVYEKPTDLELKDAKSELMLKMSMLLLFAPAPFLLHYILTASCPDPEDYACGIMFPGYFPGCMGSWRPFCAVVHLFSSYSLSYIGYLSSCFYSQLSEYIVIYLQFFQEMLKKIPTIDDWEERWQHVNMTLKYHQRILDLYEWYYRLVKDAFLIHVFGTPIILAVLAYTFLTDFRIQNMVYSWLWVFSLSFVCFFGQRMVDESETVTEIAYQSIPFDGDRKTAKDLCFMILRSQKTLHTPAGSLTHCGKGLFVAVMKTTYSYLAVMQSTGAADGH